MMDGTASPSVRSCRTYRVTARARCLIAAEGVSSGVVTTLLLWRRKARTPGAIGASCAGIWRGTVAVLRTLAVCLGGPRLGLGPKPSRQRAYAAEAIGSTRSGPLRFDPRRLELARGRFPNLERYRKYAAWSAACQGFFRTF